MVWTTAGQLRARRLSPAGLEPVAWLYYNRLLHRICPLYDRTAARPIRPLTERQRRVASPYPRDPGPTSPVLQQEHCEEEHTWPGS
jgi:hypothetical protein